MERPHQFDPDLALFLADSSEVSERLEMLNQKLLAVLETIPDSFKEMWMAAENPPSLHGEQGRLEGSVDTCYLAQQDPNQPQGYFQGNFLTEYFLREDV